MYVRLDTRGSQCPSSLPDSQSGRQDRDDDGEDHDDDGVREFVKTTTVNDLLCVHRIYMDNASTTSSPSLSHAQAYPTEFVHLVYIHVGAQGVSGGRNTRIETAVFFCSGSFFFFCNASSSSQGGFSAWLGL